MAKDLTPRTAAHSKFEVSLSVPSNYRKDVENLLLAGFKLQTAMRVAFRTAIQEYILVRTVENEGVRKKGATHSRRGSCT